MFQKDFAAFAFEIQMVGAHTLEMAAEGSFANPLTTNRHVITEVLNI